MNNKLQNQIALITGGGTGLGREIAVRFASEGAHTILCGRTLNSLEQAREEITKCGGACVTIRADVSSEKEVEEMFSQVTKQFAGLDILVNNAGIAGPTAPVTAVSLTAWNETLAANLTGAFLCARAAAKIMIPRCRGKIIHIASIAGKIAYPLRAPYAVSKWGLLGLSRTLAAELGEKNIQVNAIAPGPVAGERMERIIQMRAAEMSLSEAEMKKYFLGSTAMKKFVSPKHVAELALLLASSAGDSITGQVFSVDCGWGL